jgi:sugar phosphate permease
VFEDPTFEVIAAPHRVCDDRQRHPKGRAPMHQTVTKQVDTSRRWWVLAIVVAAQFMFGVDAFVVNVAIPTIAVELKASPAQIESVIAIYLIAYATLVVTGGRLGDIHGTRNVFLAGLLGFTLTSLWCGLAQSGAELIVARLTQGASAALMVPQVLATLHLLFTDEQRNRAFAIYGIVLGLAGAAGFLLGGLLVTIDLAPALTAQPAHPRHRADGHHDRGHQPPQDLHRLRVGRPTPHRRPRNAGASRSAPRT